MLGAEVRRAAQQLSRTRVCVDRDGTVDDMSEGGFARLPPELRYHRSRVGVEVM
jgi:hypothetical protein